MQAQQRNETDQDETETSMIPFAKQLYLQQGPRVFLQGMETSAFQSALEKALYFFAYTALKEMYQTITRGAALDTLTNLALGCAAEWAHLPITLPVDALTTKIQTSNGNTPMKVLMAMLADKNTKWYRGIEAYTLLCFKPSIQYTVFEQVKAILVKTRKNKSLTAAEAFLLGMLARTIATIAVFPFLRAKVLIQTSSQQDKQSIRKVLYQCYQTQGFSGLFQGLGPELTRGVFSAALMLMLKERIAASTRKLIATR